VVSACGFDGAGVGVLDWLFVVDRWPREQESAVADNNKPDTSNELVTIFRLSGIFFSSVNNPTKHLFGFGRTD
jgi:hypothetical protein